MRANPGSCLTGKRPGAGCKGLIMKLVKSKLQALIAEVLCGNRLHGVIGGAGLLVSSAGRSRAGLDWEVKCS